MSALLVLRGGRGVGDKVLGHCMGVTPQGFYIKGGHISMYCLPVLDNRMIYFTDVYSGHTTGGGG